MKHIATVALMLNLGVAGVYAQQKPVKMTASGTLEVSTLNLQPNTNTDEQNLDGNGTLGPFTFRELHADPASPSLVGTKGELGYGLDENAILAVRRLRLQPAMKNGEPFDVAVDIPVDFRLDDARENHPVNPPSFTRQLCTSVKPLQLVVRIQPEYTKIAKQDRVTGVVSLDVVVRKDGTVDVSRVAESLDHGLDSAAVDALSRWMFTPRTCDGAPLDTPLKLEVNFNLR
jgi:TonB family protein